MTTWNPIEKGSVTTLSNGNLTANNILQNSSVKSTDPKSSGKWFSEIKVDALNINCIGIGSSDLPMTSGITSSNNFFYYYFDGRKSNGGLTSTYASTLSVGDIIGILIDFDAGTLTYYKNGVNLGIAFDNIKKLSNFCIVVSSGTLSGNGGVTANFGATPFKYLPNSNDLPFGVKSYDGSQTLSHESKSFIFHEYQYKKFISKTLGTPAHWETVSSTLPSSTIFFEQGMDILSLIDRKVMNLESTTMTQRSDILGEEVGKVFSKTIDLNRYFDIRIIMVEVK